MIYVHVVENGKAQRIQLKAGEPLPASTVWVDILAPTVEEEETIESQLHLDVPTKEETLKNEVLNRTYVYDHATYMTALVTLQSDTDYPATGAVIFIHTEKCLVTVRYDEIRAFKNFNDALAAEPSKYTDGESVFEGLLSEFASRLADVCEGIIAELNLTARIVFSSREVVSCDAPLGSREYDKIIKVLGRKADHVAKIHESLQSLQRALVYFRQTVYDQLQAPTVVERLRNDFAALDEETRFITTKIGFLLEATLGLINLQQNMIIKIFSVAAVMLMPATLVASVYGMNFKHMPELEWTFGYPMALCLMVLSAVLPYLYFKKRKWL